MHAVLSMLSLAMVLMLFTPNANASAHDLSTEKSLETRVIFYGFSLTQTERTSGIDYNNQTWNSKRNLHFLILGVEQELTPRIAMSATWQQAIEWSDESFSSYPLELKYKFSDQPKTWYAKGGVHGYELTPKSWTNFSGSFYV